MNEPGWPWRRGDTRMHGWQGTTFGPLSVVHPVRPERPRATVRVEHKPIMEIAAEAAPEPPPEQRAASALLSEAHAAEARRHFGPLTRAVGTTKREPI